MYIIKIFAFVFINYYIYVCSNNHIKQKNSFVTIPRSTHNFFCYLINIFYFFLVERFQNCQNIKYFLNMVCLCNIPSPAITIRWLKINYTYLINLF
jgi:hypothetical protein